MLCSHYKDQTVIAVLGKQSLFIVRIAGNTQVCYVGRLQSFSILKQLVHREPLGIEEQSADTALHLPYQLLGTKMAGKVRSLRSLAGE
jgi:hypothetical protein